MEGCLELQRGQVGFGNKEINNIEKKGVQSRYRK